MLVVLAFFFFQASQSSLEGRVVRLGSENPVARARLILTKIQGQLRDTRTTTADETGKFSIPNLPAGRYRLFAEHEGYIRAEHDQRGASRTGTPITLADRQNFRDIVITMTPTGVITGRVRDADGRPVRNVVVRVLRAVYREGQRTLNSIQVGETDDLGEYRIFGLVPGMYFVSALPAPGPRIEGDEYVVPVIPTRDNGNRRETRTAGNVAIASGSVDPSVYDREAFLTVYYPGTTNVTTAAPIDLQAGAIVSGIDLHTARSRTVNVRGRVINGITGQPAEAVSVSVASRSENGISRSGKVAMGRFDIAEVTPGSYNITAQTTSTDERLFARVPLEVGDRDVENISLTLQSGFTLTGRLTVEGRPSTDNDTQAPRPFVQLQPGYSFPVNPDGTFATNNVNPGNYRLRMMVFPANWYIKSAVLGSTEVLNAGIRLEADPRTPLNIVVGTNGASLDVLVVDAQRRPVQGGPVALVPDASRRHRFDLYRSAVTDASGRVRLQGIAPGDYKALAWTEMEQDSWQDPTVIRTYENRGESVRFDEGARQSLTLTVIGRVL
jgi:hypothetical protein